MLCLVMHCLLCIYCSVPLCSPVDPETDDAAVIDYVTDDPSLSEQPGKQTPLSIPISPISFPRMLALELLLLFV